MRKFALLVLVLMLALGIRSDGNAGALGSSLATAPFAEKWSDLVVQIKKKKKKHDGDMQGEHSCPPGYMVLDKPNKYGAYCELVPKEPPAPKETPVEWAEFVRDVYGTNVTPEALSVPFKNECAYYKKSYTNCEIITASPNTHIRCACHYQK